MLWLWPFLWMFMANGLILAVRLNCPTPQKLLLHSWHSLVNLSSSTCWRPQTKVRERSRWSLEYLRGAGAVLAAYRPPERLSLIKAGLIWFKLLIGSYRPLMATVEVDFDLRSGTLLQSSVVVVFHQTNTKNWLSLEWNQKHLIQWQKVCHQADRQESSGKCYLSVSNLYSKARCHCYQLLLLIRYTPEAYDSNGSDNLNRFSTGTGSLFPSPICEHMPWRFIFPAGLCVLCSTVEDQQAHPGTMHGQPRALHEEEEARYHRGPADEGSGQRGEAPETDGEVWTCIHIHIA